MLILALIKTKYILLLMRLMLKAEEDRKSTTVVSKLKGRTLEADGEEAKGVWSSSSLRLSKGSRSIFSSSEPICEAEKKIAQIQQDTKGWQNWAAQLRVKSRDVDVTMSKEEAAEDQTQKWERRCDSTPFKSNHFLFAFDGRQLRSVWQVTSHTSEPSAKSPLSLSIFLSLSSLKLKLFIYFHVQSQCL